MIIIIVANPQLTRALITTPEQCSKISGNFVINGPNIYTLSLTITFFLISDQIIKPFEAQFKTFLTLQTEHRNNYEFKKFKSIKLLGKD